MRVNLRVGFFGNKAYTVRASAEALFFESAEETLRIPYADIKRITLRGEASSTEGFSLEAGGEIYRGHFETMEEAKLFLDAVGERMEGKLEIDLSRI